MRILFLFAFVFTSLQLSGQTKKASFNVFAVADLYKIFEDGYNLPPSRDSVYLFGIKGEVVSGQCVVLARKDLANVRVEISTLRSQSGDEISADNLEWNFVGYIPLTENAPNQPADILVRQAPARFPDFLMADRELNISKGVTQAIWLTINIPYGVETGIFHGNVLVKSADGEQILPVVLKVYPLQMPEERHLKIAEWFTTRHFKSLHGIQEAYSKEWFDMLKVYAENLVDHRQNVFQVPMNTIMISKLSTGEYEFDFSRFDQIADVFWNTGKMDYLETGELTRFGEEAWFSTDIYFRDFTVWDRESAEEITVPGMEMIPHLLPAFENHLRSRGWLDKTYFHVKDEPTLRNVTSWKEKSSIIKQYAPDLVRIDAIETTHLFEDIEVAIPKLDYLAGWYDVYRRAAHEGVELWYYTVGIYQGSRYPNKTIDMPLIDTRIMHWINYKYDLEGYLHWGWNQWTENPFEAVGMHIGDGWHVYPVQHGVLNSLRWEQMRNGIQDFEYLWLLEQKICQLKDSLGSRFSWIDPKQRGKEIAGRVVNDFMHRTSDSDVLYNARESILNEILDFDSSPRIYIQTNPGENFSNVKATEYLLEVFGWAEKGTKIMVNGDELELSDQGLFLRNLKLTLENNEIVVEGRKGPDIKRITRRFMVVE